MASVLQVATIKDQGGNNNAIEIANTSANVTINNLTSSTGFPDGMVTNTIVRKYAFGSNGSYANTTTSEKIFTRTSSSSTTVSSFTAKLGYTYVINMIYYGYVARASGNNSGRVADVKMYFGDTSRSQGDTSFDTKLHSSKFGRDLASSHSSGGQTSFSIINMVGAFYRASADGTVYYYGTSYQGSTDKTAVVYMSTDHPGYDIIHEVRGNIATFGT